MNEEENIFETNSKELGVEFLEDKSIAQERVEGATKREEDIEGLTPTFLVRAKIARNKRQANFMLIVLAIFIFIVAIIFLALGRYRRDQLELQQSEPLRSSDFLEDANF